MPADPPTEAAVAALAPSGTLRAAINLSNFLLVTGTTATGDPDGVSPDLARELARRLGVGLALVPYASPGELADAVTGGAWDVGNIGAEPQRAEHIAFSAAYCEIDATYLVPPGSPLQTIADVDRPGIRIASSARAAYDLWLERNLRHAGLVRAQGLAASYDLFAAERLDALAGLRPRLLSELRRMPGARVLDGRFTAVQQAIGTPRDRDPAGLAYLEAFVADVTASGLVAGLIGRHGVVGLSVAAV